MLTPPQGGRTGALPIRYVVVAGATTLGYLGVLKLFLTTDLPYMVSILCAQAVVIPVAFVAYRSLVFGPGSTVFVDFTRFVGVWAGGAILGAVATPILVELVRMDPWIAQLLAILVVAGISFLSHLRLSFRRSGR
ncbi:GtrA family protein [Monashia sp. NPDC004114]